MTTEDDVCRHVMIHGRVQGVGYRAWVEAEATARSLAGFVRNRRDGSVEAMFCGPFAVVTDMLDRCRRGPAHAQVTHIDPVNADATSPPSHRAAERFAVWPTV